MAMQLRAPQRRQAWSWSISKGALVDGACHHRVD
jgi:hypothetical protein